MSVTKLRSPIRVMPSEGDLLQIPIASTGEYELNDKEVRQLRVRLYALNKNNDIFRWRSMRDGPYLIVWKLSK